MDQNDRVDMGTFEINSAQEIQDKLASLKDASTNKPSEEEIELAKKELDLTSEEFREKLYEIGKPDEFEKIYNFIHNFLENALWLKEAWMGILKLDEEIDETFNKDFNKNDKKKVPFTFGFQALEFTHFMFSNSGGVGLKRAKEMKETLEEFNHIFELVSEQIENARKKGEEIQWLHDKWLAMQQGFYLEREDGIEKLEEETEEKTKDI